MTMLTEPSTGPDEQLIPIDKLSKWAETQFDFSARTIRWYASEGLIPKPEHHGREAFFHPVIISYLWTISLLQKDFKLKLPEIRSIIRNLEKAEDTKSEGEPLIQVLADTLLNFYKQYTLVAESKVDFSRTNSREWQRHNMMAAVILDIVKNQPKKIRILSLFDLQGKVEGKIQPLEVFPF